MLSELMRLVGKNFLMLGVTQLGFSLLELAGVPLFVEGFLALRTFLTGVLDHSKLGFVSAI